MKRIRAIIVDDEELARRGIELRLQKYPEIEVVAHCANGREAVSIVALEQPDLMFLDIQMPGLTGFDVVSRLAQECQPLVVFVTAYDRYALDAFETQALDYLLKPIDDERFAATMQRVRERLHQQDALNRHAQVMRLLAQLDGVSELDGQEVLQQLRGVSGTQYATSIAIRGERETQRLAVALIDWIDAAGDYMCLHAQGETYILRETMKSLEELLDPSQFQRVHRSTIVNLRRVEKLRPHSNGEYFLTLAGGSEIKLSRSYRDRVGRLLNI